MWVMVIADIPTTPRPELGSVHFAVPWPYRDEAPARKRAKRRTLSATDFFVRETAAERFARQAEESGQDPDGDFIADAYGWEANPAKAVKVRIGESDVRLWAHEIRALTAATMNDAIREGVLQFRAGAGVIETRVANNLTLPDGDRESVERQCYDAALLDGCTEQEAVMVALQMPVEPDDPEFPPNIGWYAMVPEYVEALGLPYSPMLTQKNFDRRAASHARRARAGNRRIAARVEIGGGA